MAQVVLGQCSDVPKVGKSHFRLYHPKLGQMPGGVGVFRPEGRSEGIDIAQRAGVSLRLKLAADRQLGGLAEKILLVVNLAAFRVARQVFQIQMSDLEHFAGALAVAAGDNGGMEIEKIAALEKLVGGVGEHVAQASHRSESIGARTQMRQLAQALEGDAAFAQGVLERLAKAQNPDAVCLQLEALSGRRRLEQAALGDNRGAGVQLEQLAAVVGQLLLSNDLKVL